jgi:transposase
VLHRHDLTDAEWARLEPLLPSQITGPRHLDIVLREYLQHFNAHRPHRLLDQRPPAGGTPPRSGATIRPLRRDRLGGLVHEYVQVA